MIMYEALAKHPRLFEPDDIPEIDPARRNQLDGVFGEFGHKSWTGIAIHKRVQLIEHLWTDEVARDQLHFFRRVVHRMNNQAFTPAPRPSTEHCGAPAKARQRSGSDRTATGSGRHCLARGGRSHRSCPSSSTTSSSRPRFVSGLRPSSVNPRRHSGPYPPRTWPMWAATIPAHAAAARSTSVATVREVAQSSLREGPLRP
jgi:hypothetical protein